jgi:hypothetical protein
MLSHYYIMFSNLERTVQKKTICYMVGYPTDKRRIKNLIFMWLSFPESEVYHVKEKISCKFNVYSISNHFERPYSR